MELSQNHTVKIVALLLLIAAIIQPIYTALYVGAPDIDRQFLWGLEGLLFVLLATFAGSAMVMTKPYALGFSAIAFCAVLNVVQVGIGLTQFGPFREAAAANPELSGITESIRALSFFVYNAAKILLGLAAATFGMAMLKRGSNILGRTAILVGILAFIANTLVMMFGTRGFIPSPIAGGSGVLATFLLAICLFRLSSENLNSPLGIEN